MLSEPPEPELVHWRKGPCEICAGGATILDFLIGRHAADSTLSGGSADDLVEELTSRERAWLVEWVESCPHTRWESSSLTKLDEGSEHIVYRAPGEKQVIKLTRPVLYGDTYHLVNGRVHQRRATPADYLIRLSLIENTFGFSSTASAITKWGQILTVQDFVKGEPPTQTEVDEFLLGEGIEPVRRSCWLWKKTDDESGVEWWIGDARADNFVKTATGIVPIDLRMWGVVREDSSATH